MKEYWKDFDGKRTVEKAPLQAKDFHGCAGLQCAGILRAESFRINGLRSPSNVSSRLPRGSA
jgi:hypothetical protein